MTRNEFRTIAYLLREHEASDAMIEAFAEEFEEMHTNFDRTNFIILSTDGD